MAAPEHDEAARQQALDDTDRELRKAADLLALAEKASPEGATAYAAMSLATSVAAVGRLIVFALREDTL